MAEERQIRHVTVYGAGIMGRGIAYVALLGGYHCTLVDINASILEAAKREIEGFFDEGIRRGKVAPDEKLNGLERLTLSTDIERSAQAADFVIEAVPEDMKLKLDLLSRVEARVAETVVIASNTSSLSITELGAALEDPTRFAGMHFFNPVPRMKLVEIVRGLETTDKTVRIIETVARGMGKAVVVVKDSPGFITSRMNALIGNEAFYMLMEGLATAEDIDRAIKLGLNHPMGPFEMVDMVGLDTRLAVLRFLHERLGEKYRPCPLLIQYVKAGRLGRKVGRGVYTYEKKDPSESERP